MANLFLNLSDMQIKNSFDPETIKKIKSSALIVTATEAIVVVPMFATELTQYVLNHDPIDWRTPVAMSIGIFSTWIVASVRQWMKGKDIDETQLPIPTE